jgi:peptide/nickel transport system substrate-binding protein
MKVYSNGQNIPRRTFLKLAAGAMASSALAACMPAAGPAQAPAEEALEESIEVVLGMSWNHPSFNPLSSRIAGTAQKLVFDPIFERLFCPMEWGPGVETMEPPAPGELHLQLAEKVEEVEKNRVWNVHLRKDVKWHDGVPMTADDVVWTYYAMVHRDVTTTLGSQYFALKGAERLHEEGGDELEGVKKIDDYTVRFEFEKPDPYGIGGSPVSFGRYWYVCPKHGWKDVPLEKVGTYEPMAMKPIGTGPFKVNEIVAEQYAELVANEDWWGGRSVADKYIFRFLSREAMDAALQAEEIMAGGASGAEAWSRLGEHPNLVAYNRPTIILFAMDYHNDRLGDMVHPLCEATLYALDMDEILEKTHYGLHGSSSYVFEHVPGPVGEPPEGLKTYDYNPQKAREVLEEAGWDFERELEWAYWADPSPMHLEIQERLADVGIKTKWRVIDEGSWVEVFPLNADYDIVLEAWFFTPRFEEMFSHVGCGWDHQTRGGRNWDGYCNPALDEAWQAAMAEEDTAKQVEMFREVALIMQENWQWAPLYRNGFQCVFNKRLQGCVPPLEYGLNVAVPYERMTVAPA